MISKMKERRRWNNKNNEEGRKMYRQINNELRKKQIKQEQLIGRESVRNWKIGMPKEGLT